jgi:predicted aspartyl protease
MRNIVCFLAAGLAFAGAVHAEDCGQLISYGAVPLIHLEDHASEFIPVEINGVARIMLIDTGASATVMARKAVAELQLNTGRSDGGVYDVTGNRSLDYTKAPLKIGNLKGDVSFMVGTPYLDQFGDARFAGLLGTDILKKFDVAIDYGGQTFTLFNQNHCDGQVIYWPERPVAVIPFKLQYGDQIVFPVTLDGHEVLAQLDTGASRTTLTRARAEGHYGLVLGSADTPSLGKPGGLEVWRHRFASLSLAGLEVNNPEIDIIPDKMTESMTDWSTGSLLDRKQHTVEQAPMLLGMNVLKHLRIYIAFHEKKIYISPASAPAAAPPAK